MDEKPAFAFGNGLYGGTRVRAIPSLLVFLASVACFAGELDIARQALRDGLWDVARNHAGKSDSPQARILEIESFAREGNWKALLDTLKSPRYPDCEPLAYYRALALFNSGETDNAAEALGKRVFRDPVYSNLVNRLHIRMVMKEKGLAEALAVARSSRDGQGGEDMRMFIADLMAATGDTAGAEEIWRETASRGTNVSERAFIVARVGLGDEPSLRAAFERAESAEMKRFAGFALGRLLLRSEVTFEEGVALVRKLVRQSPDAAGAKEGFIDLIDAYISFNRFKDAVAVCRETFDIWPDTAKSFDLKSDLAWSLSKLGRTVEALDAYAQAGKTARDDSERAEAVVRQGDVLASAGKVDEALARYRLVLEKYPDTESARRVEEVVRIRDLEDKGRSLFSDYRYEEAQEIFRRIAREDVLRKPRMDYYEVMTLFGQGLEDEAEEKALAVTGESPDPSIRAAAALWLGKFYFNRSRWKESRIHFSSFAEMLPDSPEAPDALVWAARAAFAQDEFAIAIQIVTNLAKRYPKTASCGQGLLVQGESLIELARFDEAVLVLERAAMAAETAEADRLRARLLGADALFAMGADNSLRYQEALAAYRNVMADGSLDRDGRINVSYKIAKTLEKLKRIEEAVECYYTEVVLAYRNGRAEGLAYNDGAKASFSRAAFRLADEFESRGRDAQAVNVLRLVEKSDVPAAVEARRRIDRIKKKGDFL